MDKQIAAKIREIQRAFNKGNGNLVQVEQLLNDLKDIIYSDIKLKHYFWDLSAALSRVLLPIGFNLPNGDDFLERAAQLFEANGITHEIKKLNMGDQIELFKKLDQVRVILKERVLGYFKSYPNKTVESAFWSDYEKIGCDSGFTFDRYDKLVKLINSHSLPNDLLLSCTDTDGNQISHGDKIQVIREIVHVQSGKKIPKDAVMVVKQYNGFKNYIEADFEGTSWVIHGSQVIRV